MKKIVLLLVGIVIWLGAVSQTDCYNYLEESCGYYGGWDYVVNSQSRSATFHKGQKSSFNIIVYKGLDYHVSVCGDKNLGEIRLKIIEDNTKKSILYDNFAENYHSEVIFSVENTRKLKIEVSTSGDVKEDDDTYCIGVLIEHRKIQPTGF